MRNTNRTIMGIDLGTQSIKVIIYNPVNKQIIAIQSCPLDMISKPDGTAEQEAKWWIDGLIECLHKIDSAIRKTVVAIGVSGQQHGFVPIDRNGAVLSSVKLWCDTSTVAECQEITEKNGGKDGCIDIAGNPIAVGYTASKILWFKTFHPKSYDRMATILLPHDYLNFYLTGRRVMECGDASGTGLLDIRKRIWCRQLIETIDPERDLTTCLPDLLGSDDIVGFVSDEIADLLGLEKDVVVSAGGGDNMMAAIGTGNVISGQLTASLGTSGTLFAFNDRPSIDPMGEFAAFCSSTGGWLPLLCTMNCTAATEQIRNLIEADLEQMESLASFVPAGSEGVITIPFFNGERTPDLPNAKAAIFGLGSHNTTNAHLVRSSMEAAIFNLKAGMAAFERCGMTFNDVTLTGGGSKSGLWRQICADILNLPVRVLTIEENAAFGAALQALWGYKKYIGDPEPLINICKEHLQEDLHKRCIPDTKTAIQYEKTYQEYRSFVKLISQHYR